MNNLKIEKQLFYVFLTVLFLVQLYLLLLNEQTYEGTDNVTHFHIARYAFKYPHLFLDLWGKPVYTTLVAPFAQLGYKFAQVFNLLTAIATLLLVFKISKKLFPNGSLYIVILSAFAPVYFLLMLTCLTEILFSFFLVATVYFFMKNRLILAAIVLSFIPFVRSEGFIFFPIFTLAFLIQRSYLPVLFLSAGTLFYSFIGYFVFDDLFWILNRFPYQLDDGVYGSGELLHFVKNSNFIFGLPLAFLSLLGIVVWSSQILSKFRLNDRNLILFLIIAGSWLAYFAAHSYVWWQGKSSLGLIRVMGGIIPLAALTAVKGVQFVFEKIKNRKLAHLVLLFITGLQVFMFFNMTRLPLKAGAVEKLIFQSSDFLKNEVPDAKIYYFNPDFAFQLGLNPYDSSKSGWFFGDRIQPSNSMDFGDILIWDAHFGPNEGRVSFNTVENDPYLQKIKTFLPEEKITVLGGYEYEIHIYRKEKQPAQQPVSDEFFRPLEIGKPDSEKVTGSEEGFIKIQQNQEYSPSILVYMHELMQKDIFEVHLQVQVKSNESIENKDVLLVISLEDGRESLKYATLPITLEPEQTDWKDVSFSTRFPAGVPESAVVKMYIWNRGKKHFFIREMNSKIVSF